MVILGPNLEVSNFLTPGPELLEQNLPFKCSSCVGVQEGFAWALAARAWALFR